MTNITEVDFNIPANDIPRMLRVKADAIERGEISPLSIALIEYYGRGIVEVYGYGRYADAEQVYMILDRGKIRLMDVME